MNFFIEKPKVLYLLLLLIPYGWYMFSRFARIVKNLGRQKALVKDENLLSKYKVNFSLRTVFRMLAWVMIVLAYAGLSWGTNFIPVQKNGRAVSMVFDISYSMEAKDGPGEITRLQAAAAYAGRLLDNIPNTSVSVVLAKGDGVVAVPLTEDTESVRSILTVLSPTMMTSQGSSLGKGIETAITSFPPQSAQSDYIWLFTDGEETDSALQLALTQAAKYGIPVAIIGFGSERESTVLAGDRSTKVKTALRAASIQETIEAVKKRTFSQSGSILMPDLFYVDASEVGSANKLLSSLLKKSGNPITSSGDLANEETSTVYELQTVDRHNIFLIFAVVFIAISFIFGELQITLPKRKKLEAEAALAIFSIFLTGCSAQRIKDGSKILEGRLNWNRKDYQEAVADFMDVEQNAGDRGDLEIQQYALYGLATTYLMQNENSSAQTRYEQINPDAPDEIRFSVLYNSGIIEHRNGNYSAAAEFFKQALLIKSSDVDAKINLELSLKEATAHANAQEAQLTPISENTDEISTMENAMYTTIRENEQQQWKNRQQESESSGLDY